MATVDRKTMIMIAKLYYLGNLSQEEIAQMMNLSRLKVSRVLKACRERRLVEFRFNDAVQYDELAQSIKELYGLQEVIVVPSEANLERRTAAVGEKTAMLLVKLLRDGMNIGFSWGRHVTQMVRQFPPITFNGCMVVQLTGGTYIPTMNFDANEVIRDFARKIDARFSLLQTPLTVQNVITREYLMQEPAIKRHFDLFGQIDVAVVGCGSSNCEESPTYLSGHMTLEEARLLQQQGVGADLCGHRMTHDGLPADCSLSGRVLSIDLPTLKKVPMVIAATSGADKVETLLAGIRGGILKAMVIDELAAIGLLKAPGIQ